MADSFLPIVCNRITSVEFVGNRTCCGWTVSWCFKGPVSCFSTGELAERVGGGGPLETILLKGGRWGHTRNSRLNKSRLASACENKKALSVPVYSNTMRRDSCFVFKQVFLSALCSFTGTGRTIDNISPTRPLLVNSGGNQHFVPFEIMQFSWWHAGNSHESNSTSGIQKHTRSSLIGCLWFALWCLI